MHVDIPPKLEAFIQSQISSGAYSSAAEVVRDAVRRIRPLTAQPDSGPSQKGPGREVRPGPGTGWFPPNTDRATPLFRCTVRKMHGRGRSQPRIAILPA